MDLDKIKLRIGIDTNDDGFDKELEAFIQDAEDELSIFMGRDILAPEKLYKSFDLFVQCAVIIAYQGDYMAEGARQRLEDRKQAGKNAFAVEVFNNGQNI